ncbi:glycosyltransferase family 2 protein [Patescibacteria group bacterium]|nr:MAG: glycosyltransferase family 2 protein [Patescibacteria group bacterium]
MSYKLTPYFKVGRASDLQGKDRVLYRALEILPGFLSWTTLITAVLLSIFAPVTAAYFIIALDVYWLLKTAYLSLHLRHNWKRIRYNLSVNWSEMLSKMKYEHIFHLVILPYYKEDLAVVEQSIRSLLETEYDKKKMAVVLAVEERAGEKAIEIGKAIEGRYAKKFGHFLVTVHPADVPGEMAGKGSNISYAAEEARKKILDPSRIPYKDVIVSAFDVDTVAYEQYFLCLTWHFLTSADPYKVSFQPVPFYNNNIWQAPAISRVAAGSSTFWQMMQQERPEKLATFSSHSVSFQSLYEVGYWQKNMVSEDSRIFWNLFVARSGDYSVVPLSYPVSMDANLAPSLWQTMKNIYRQQRRWTWGVENIPYILFAFIKNKAIPFCTRLRVAFVQMEGFWSLATNPIMIFLLGWLPVILGGERFNKTILSYNLPVLTRNIMIVAMLGLVLSSVIFISFLPERPKERGKLAKLSMVLQWILIPFTIVVFGAIPGLDAQTRLMFGKYLGFWVTPKHRK